LSKLKSTYIDALPKLVHPETGRVHTSYNQTVTATGRLSSSDPISRTSRFVWRRAVGSARLSFRGGK